MVKIEKKMRRPFQLVTGPGYRGRGRVQKRKSRPKSVLEEKQIVKDKKRMIKEKVNKKTAALLTPPSFGIQL